MYFEEYLNKIDNNIKLFIDMDGVVADYDFGKAYDYHKKRPLFDNIKKLEKISKKKNIELYILSVTRQNVGYNQKMKWLNKNMPFIKKENIFIISREANNLVISSILKANFLKKFDREGCQIVVIDDDPRVLKEIHKKNEDVILLKDTVLTD